MTEDSDDPNNRTNEEIEIIKKLKEMQTQIEEMQRNSRLKHIPMLVDYSRQKDSYLDAYNND